ncbi:MAG: super-infection exclusion protein B [Deltaproteobacteria bacterium]|nr:super-infection exclusion protein B [Deltaproteobacteria bacterium]
MVTPDPKWLEILKASGWQTTAIAAACGIFLLFARRGWLPPLDPWMILIATFGLLLCGFLAISAIFSSTPVQKWIKQRLTVHREKRAVRDYIQHMTEKEREIISYLLAKNQKTFFYTIDGGYAATLISRGIVVCGLRPGQAGSPHHIPFIIPDHIWSILMEHKKEFPYKRPPRGETKIHPWAISWMVR